MTDAVVVGAGPNGLVAAVELARAGVNVTVYEAADRIGGGARSSELTLPGLLHDDCSAFHPTGAGSPALQQLDRQRHGLRWRYPEIDLAHPLDDGNTTALYRSLDETRAGLDADGAEWARLFGPLSRRFDALFHELSQPLTHVPRHVPELARFGIRALQPVSTLARRWRGVPARALFAGVAAHALRPARYPMSSAVGMLLTAAGHAYGWPVAEGGSQAISDALAARLRELGGTIETSVEVGSLEDLGQPDVVLLDVSPPAAARLLRRKLPWHVARAYRRYRFGPGAYKLDLAVSGGIPWTNEHCRRAGTVHLGGTLEEIAHAESEVTAGRMPERPFVLVGQQHLADPSRSAGDVHPIWTYAHVPNGYSGDASEAIIAQLERFAPGIRDRIVARFARSAPEMAAYNPNYVGGDIAIGSNDTRQLVFRPRVAADPYRTGVDGVYLCSAATPPGGGVHGMCGYNAAHSALRSLRA